MTYYARPQFPEQVQEFVPFSVVGAGGRPTEIDCEVPVNLSVRNQSATESGRPIGHQECMYAKPTWAHVAASQQVYRPAYTNERYTGNAGYDYYSVSGSQYIPRPRAFYDYYGGYENNFPPLETETYSRAPRWLSAPHAVRPPPAHMTQAGLARPAAQGYVTPPSNPVRSGVHPDSLHPEATRIGYTRDAQSWAHRREFRNQEATNAGTSRFEFLAVKYLSVLHHARNWQSVPVKVKNGLSDFFDLIQLPCPDRSDRSPLQVLKDDWLSSLHRTGLEHLDKNKTKLLSLLTKYEPSVLTDARPSLVSKLRTKFGRKFRQRETNKDLANLRQFLEQAATLRSNQPIAAAPPTPTVPSTTVEPMVEGIEPVRSEHPRKRTAPTPSPDRDQGRCSKHALIDTESVSTPAKDEVENPPAEPIGFSLTESPATPEFKTKAYDPDVEPSSDEESVEPTTVAAVCTTNRFNPLKTTAEVYVCLSDEEDHLVDSQATIIYTQEEATSKELPSKIPLQQKQLKQATLSKGSLSQSASNPTVSLPRLSLTAHRSLSQGNAKLTKTTANT